MLTHLTIKSANVKVGPIPVSTSSRATCPTSCAFATHNEGGCYAASGPLALHWAKVTSGERGMAWPEFTASIAALPDGQLWRHNQAGDLPGDGERIDAAALAALVSANAGKRGFTYTHYNPRRASNRRAIAAANAGGFTVNLSAEDMQEADELADMNIGPVAVVLPITQLTNARTPGGRTVVVCPAVVRDDVSCSTCQLCQRQRSAIIGFPAHGTGAKRADGVARRVIPLQVAA